MSYSLSFCPDDMLSEAIEASRAQSFFRRLLDVAPWAELRNTKGTSVTRSTCWYCTGGCTCDYAYGQQTRAGAPR